MATSVGPISGPTDLNEQTNQKKAMFINEASLYRLTLRSKYSKAEEFTDWVCSEVLPSIKKHGTYETPKATIERIRNPTG
ncbi:MAG: Bro-N domain-containing protein, partial [Candidatus Fonsibacter sp.]